MKKPDPKLVELAARRAALEHIKGVIQGTKDREQMEKNNQNHDSFDARNETDGSRTSD